MKKKLLVFTLFVLSVGLFATTYKISNVGADSGFDSSWDSGSSWGGSSWDSGSSWGGSSWDSGSSWGSYSSRNHNYSSHRNSYGSGSYSKENVIDFIVVFFVLVVAGISIYLISQKNNKKKDRKLIDDALNSKLELLDINKFPEHKRLEIQAFNIYKELQYAWMNFDEETIRKLTTDEMYNMYLMQLDTLKAKKQINIMHKIKYLHSYIDDSFKENGQDTIIINMQVGCYDFLIDADTKKVLRGVARYYHTYTYQLIFVKTVNEKNIEICPNCGAPVEGNNSGICEYCKSTLVSDNYTLILSKKKMRSQK